MFEIIKAWDRFNRTNQFAEDDELQIIFPKAKVLVSDEQTLKNIQLMLDLGLIEEWEKFIKMDPNLSEQEAKEKLERINTQKEEQAMKLLGGAGGNLEERDDEEGEAES